MRTDRTTLCADCAVRFPAADLCPRCGGTDLFDLTRPKARREAWHAVQHPRHHRASPTWGERLASAYIKYGIFLVTVAGTLLGWRTGRTWVTAFVFGIGAFWTALALFFVGGGITYFLALLARILFALAKGAVSEVTDRTSFAPRRHIVAIDDQEGLAAPDVHEVRGRVRVLESVRSPLHRRECVAWRVVGDGPVGDVDDARAVPFDVVTDDGEVIRIEPAPASVAIEPESAPQQATPDRELSKFLEMRGVYPERGPVHLAEAVLEDGARVAAEGSLEGEDIGGAKASSRPTRVLRERPGAPLVIRRI